MAHQETWLTEKRGQVQGSAPRPVLAGGRQTAGSKPLPPLLFPANLVPRQPGEQRLPGGPSSRPTFTTQMRRKGHRPESEGPPTLPHSCHSPAIGTGHHRAGGVPGDTGHMQTLPLGWRVAQGVQTRNLRETDHAQP